MRIFRTLRSQLSWLFQRSQAEADLSAELQDYIENETERHMARGLSPQNARFAALREAGGIEPVKEKCRDVHGARWLDELVQDIRYALRSCRHNPGFVAAVAGTIALGLGLNTALFTVFNAYVLRPIAVHNPYSLYSLQWANRLGQEHASSWPQFQDLRKNNPAFSDVAAVQPLYSRLDGHPVQGQLVTGNYFQMLGVRSALGRTLISEDAALPGRDPVLVISYAAWENLFGRRPDIIGGKVTLRGYPMEIVGVAARQFRGLGEAPQDFWAPLTMSSHLQAGPNLFGTGHPQQLTIIGRIKPNRSLASLQAALTVQSRQLTSPLPENSVSSKAILRSEATAIALTPELLLLFSPLAAAFGLVLLLACTNVANMMLARNMARQREIGIRLSLGSVRARLVRQLLTEALLLTIPAAVLGFAVSQITMQAAIRVMFATLPQDMLDVTHTASLVIDCRVFAFMTAAAFLSAFFFGLAPALQATRGDLIGAARGEFSSDARPMRFRSLLVIAQVTGCTLLLITCGALARTTVSMGKVDLGFETAGIIALRLPEKDRSRVLNTLSASPEVDSVVAASSVPLGGPVPSVMASAQNGSTVNSSYNYVSPRYFELLHIPIVRGRGFTQSEAASQTPVAVLSSAAKRNLFPKTDPLGRVIQLEGKPGKLRVIGIAGDVITCCIPYGKDFALVYLPTLPTAAQRSLLVRVHRDVEAEKRRLEAALRESAPGALDEIHSLNQYRAVGLYPFRAASFLGMAIASVALLLTISGIYGVLSYLVTQRTKEIGIRVALGATANSVTGLVLKQSLRLTAIGLGIGIPLALIVSRLLASEMLFLRGFDAWAFSAGCLLVVSAALLAGYLPSRKATRIDPINTLRYD